MNFNPATEKFWDEKALHANMERVFDICHGCRRCFNLCPSFADLFNSLDTEQVDGEVKKLTSSVYQKVVDDCYYCKLCFNHCPYTPPHQYDLDFPRLMIQAKVQNAKKVPPRLRDRILVDIDRMGRLASLFAPLVNWGNRQRWTRLLIEKVLGIHRERLLAPFSSQTFNRWFKRRKKSPSSTKNKHESTTHTDDER